MNADVGDSTPLEGDEKLPNVIGLQQLNVQEQSPKQDARKDVFPPVVPSTRMTIHTLNKHTSPPESIVMPVVRPEADGSRRNTTTIKT